MNVITSAQNEKIKLIRSLSNKKSRKESGLFLVEGERSVFSTPDGAIKEIFIADDKQDKYLSGITRRGIEVSVVRRDIFGKIAFTEHSQGIVALARIPSENDVSGDIICVLDGISDPGNLGTIVRSAAAFGIKDLILADCCDAFDPKVVRSTMGGIFGINFVICTRARAIEIIKNKNYKPVILDMGGEDLYGWTPSGKIALTVGSEAHGVSEELRAFAAGRPGGKIGIPMPGGVESLNAAVAVSIALSWVAAKHIN